MSIFNKFTKSNPLVLVGHGKMGGAMLNGWLKAGLNPLNVIIVDPINKYAGIETYNSVKKLPKNISPKIVILGVKPQIMPQVLLGFNENKLEIGAVLSIAAGFEISKIEEVFGCQTPILRAMPNTPAAIGKGITGLYGNEATDDNSLELAKGLLGACGPVVEVEEERLINAVTAVSGSGPAYIFHMVEALAKGGEAQGLTPDIAYKLARETVIGAGALLEQSDETAKQLRENVTSPKGTTEAALNVLMDDGALVNLMKKAVKAARDRGEELSEG